MTTFPWDHARHRRGYIYIILLLFHFASFAGLRGFGWVVFTSPSSRCLDHWQMVPLLCKQSAGYESVHSEKFPCQ